MARYKPIFYLHNHGLSFHTHFYFFLLISGVM